jgi:diphthamide synthase (EF-2-diphthine--ammonia ligase)
MPALVSWSSGKDSAWALHLARRQGLEIVGLLTTTNESTDRVSMQGVRRELLYDQATVLGLPVWEVSLPYPCSNEEYERRMGAAMDRAAADGIAHVVFGDLFLEDVRAYREQTMAPTGITPLFPNWCGEAGTTDLAGSMIGAGVQATITCVDPALLDPSFAGTTWDPAELPPEVDSLGERGEFHTFCSAGPMFSRSIGVVPGEIQERDGFWWADVVPSVDPCGQV